jgi:hypothetical protein
VVEAANAALLVAPEKQRRPTVWTVRIDDTGEPVGVTKSEKVLAEDAEPDRWAVRQRNFL